MIEIAVGATSGARTRETVQVKVVKQVQAHSPMDARTHAADIAVETDVVQTRCFSSHVPGVFNRLFGRMFSLMNNLGK